MFRNSPGTTARLLILCLGLASLVFDNHPHFMLGDSVSYLSTWPGAWIPPDRSWLFGFMTHGLLVLTHSLDAYIVLQVLLQCAVAAFLARTFLPTGPARSVFIVLAVCDPLLATYARFYMSDFSAALCFVTWLALLKPILDTPQKPAPRRWAGIALAGVLAVFVRVAYVPIEALTLLLFAARALARRDRPGARRALTACLVPVMAAGLLTGANGLIFRDRLPQPFFLNRLSGVFSAGVFAPAIAAEDIRAAGIPVTDEQMRLMRLGDYHLRLAQVWGSDPTWLRQVVMKSCHTTDEYNPAVNTVMGRITRHAFLRNPAAFAGVYLRTLGYYFRPHEWRRDFDTELGLYRPFPPDFVRFLNTWLPFDPVNAETPERMSRLTWILRSCLGLYPVLLMVFTALSAAILIVSGSTALTVPACGILSSVLLAPLYSNYVIPRYILPVMALGYCLVTALVFSRISRPVTAD
ncbi:hypothetical protein GOB93_19385 [Acetobacter musti]|uniref:Glycosyltransferase RgtA/B/C/D-like domain-containing protein n=1 Tax=Acetobacter musti TaxID=864732 RepID=A0ABX0JXN9_9PROT|nr:hypothetical protein [Acetobacter musti]NHN86765.1 hypothetical protein [Acetobacter musti]